MAEKGVRGMRAIALYIANYGMWPNRVSNPRLAKRREIPRTAGNTGNSRELLVFPGNYWEIGPSSMRKF